MILIVSHLSYFILLFFCVCSLLYILFMPLAESFSVRCYDFNIQIKVCVNIILPQPGVKSNYISFSGLLTIGCWMCRSLITYPSLGDQ